MMRTDFWKKIFLNKWFLGIAAVKLIAGSIFGSDYLMHGFIPFVNYFVTSWGQNPYDFFAAQQFSSAFPYPPVMLWILAIPRLLITPFVSGDWQVVSSLHLFAAHIPIFLADAFIYAVLCRWLETKEKQVLWLYWASPILFFISYILGQLDVIPMAILFASLVMLLNKRPWHAAILLGIGITTKTHLIVVLPFYLIYWHVNRYQLKRTMLYGLTALSAVLICLLPYLWSSSFTASVFGTEEATKAYLVHLPFIYNNLTLLLAPACIVLLFLNFSAYRKLNKDAFLLILALLFSVFIVLVPPMPGWYYWSIPFFIYFFSKYQSTPQASFWLMNLAYLAYVLVAQDALLQSSLHMAGLSIFEQLQASGVYAQLVVNSIFTVLVASIIMNVVWVYRIGVRSNLEYQVDESPLVVGIGGDSGAGKNSLVHTLVALLGQAHTTTIEGDDAHKWERNDSNWQNHTHLDPKSNRLHDELRQTIGLKTGRTVQRSLYDHGTGRFTQPNVVESRRNIIYVGLHPFYLSKMRQLFSIKIYVEPDEALRRHWKILRDVQQRGKTKDEVLKQIEQREADAAKYIRPQRQFADLVINYVPKGPLVEGEHPTVKLRIIADNSLHVDPLLVGLATVHTMKVEHSYDEDLNHQTIEFDGMIHAEQIRQLAYQLIPNIDELLNVSPEWKDGYEGIIQFMVAYYYSETHKSA